jgi:hypothetical protein
MFKSVRRYFFPTVREMVAAQTKQIDRAIYDLDIEMRGADADADAAEKTMTFLGRRGGSKAELESQARRLVRAKKTSARINKSKDKLVDLKLILRDVSTHDQMGEALRTAAGALKKVNGGVLSGKLQKVITDFEYQSSIAEEANKAVDSAMEEEEDEKAENDDPQVQLLVQQALDTAAEFILNDQRLAASTTTSAGRASGAAEERQRR